ncbi:optic atrophy 3-like family protein [Tieghemostelium lacteum]|uniref:Optic atrophy 3-like family protein n=1 Tax=Tieghemostelium lacteum TaxID=361077 RepID=A0A151Z4V3_TIELA|nr:optic atrophy 3-like family protein [Tieghemostelium lacteum]|eukprot:KYQ88947.1 optic atrophy 3-like family protein [Tieghemostelium lacteum]
MVLPLLKVGSLFIKSVAKPFSKQIKIQASKSPVFHGYIVKMARIWYKLDLRLSKFTGDTTRKPVELNVNAAIDLGAEMVSEVFLLSVAVGLLIIENKRSSAKDQKKEEALNKRFSDLESTVQLQQEQIKNLESIILNNDKNNNNNNNRNNNGIGLGELKKLKEKSMNPYISISSLEYNNNNKGLFI